MPLKNRDAYRAYMREWYARPENRRRVIAKVAARKKRDYTGTCKNCGGPTFGTCKADIPEYCSKPECRSVQMRIYWGTYSPAWATPSSAGRYFQQRFKEPAEKPSQPEKKPNPRPKKPRKAAVGRKVEAEQVSKPARKAPARPRKPREKEVGVKWLAE
jgi:hypothetical protein